MTFGCDHNGNCWAGPGRFRDAGYLSPRYTSLSKILSECASAASMWVSDCVHVCMYVCQSVWEYMRKYTDVFLQNLLCLHSSQVVDIVISRTVLVAMCARSRIVSQRSMHVGLRSMPWAKVVTCTLWWVWLVSTKPQWRSQNSVAEISTVSML